MRGTAARIPAVIVRNEPTDWLVAVLAFFALARAGAAEPAVEPYAYQGSYRSDDGTVINGGRMDEGGQSALSYLDTDGASLGGVFAPAGDRFEGIYGTPGSIAFEDGGSVMLWYGPDETVRLERSMKPEVRSAAFANGEVRLAGTLFLPPERAGKLPAVVLAHGSGPTTRFLGPWVTFFVAEGYAVLAYDKRGTGQSEGNWENATYLDLSDDLVAAADWLAAQPGIDAEKIGLKTSSQSGWYGPHTVSRSPHYSFLLQRAAPAVDIAVGTGHEIRHELLADGLDAATIDAAVGFWLELHEMAANGAGLEAANEYFLERRAEPWFEPSFGPWEQISEQWWQQHAANMTLDPAATTAALSQPVLWFLAEHDENVPYRESVAALEAARRNKDNLNWITIEDAGHSFFVSEPGEPLEYTSEYWGNMARWLRATVTH